MLRFHVAGTRSGCGKTTLVCALLEVLPGWGALKVSTHPDGTRHGPEGLEADPAVLSSPGTDTARYAAAGAARVGWLRATPASLARDLPVALEQFDGLPGVLVEGNSPWRVAPGDRLVVVRGATGTPGVKRSADALASVADLVVTAAGASPADAEPSRSTVVADLGNPADAGRREAVRRVLTWTRA